MASIADVFNNLTTRWSSVARFLVVLLALFGVYRGVIYFLPKNATQLKINGVGNLVLAQSTKEGGADYLVVIHPEGWQETGISVKEGDTLSFDAGGNIYIDLGGLNESLRIRKQLEKNLIDRDTKAHRWPAERDTVDPEDGFTAAQKAAIKPVWLWNGPNGNQATADLSFPARRKKTIIPNANYGALLGAIRETGLSTPDRQDAFIVGAHLQDFVVKRTGKLYFTVNDVWDSNDPSFPEKFYIDNIGFFYCKVTVKPAK